jgi:hypothetical protein
MRLHFGNMATTMADIPLGLCDMPDEVLLRIAVCLCDPRDLWTLAQTCIRLARVVCRTTGLPRLLLFLYHTMRFSCCLLTRIHINVYKLLRSQTVPAHLHHQSSVSIFVSIFS